MPICPAGHHSAASDFCDTCGLPIPVAAATPVPPPAPSPLQPPAALVCPACGTPNVTDALFCEACGHDFLGGTQPRPDTVPDADLDSAANGDEGVSTGDDDREEHHASLEGSWPSEPAEGLPGLPDSELRPDLSHGQPEAPPQVEWIAELWIDPDWYAAQGSTDPLPSPGLPDIVPLVKESNLIGRISTSRNIYPEVDCELDTGCSRRHARLTTDGTRWWVEDLESANGTFLGTAAGPLPAMPIPRGKVELAPDQRIYLGAWTRIVVRRATDDEQAAFAGLLS